MNDNDSLIENDLDNIINNIFLNLPQKEKSIQIIFDNINDEYSLFKQLVEILVKGMKILFSNNNETVNLIDLTENDFLKLKEYFKSFGFIVAYDLNKQPNIEKKNNNSLSDYYFSLKISDTMIYYIIFDYL